jgi:hypothetical protein
MALLQGRAQRTVQTVFEIEVTSPLHDVREKVSIERRVLVEESGEMERLLGRYKLVEPDLARWQVRPLPLGEPVLWVRAIDADALEDHGAECR